MDSNSFLVGLVTGIVVAWAIDGFIAWMR